MRSLDVEQMCRTYGAPADQVASLMALAKETKSRGWWLSYSDVINEGFDVYIGLEEAATRMFGYEVELVPGLLQTADYARAVISAHTYLTQTRSRSNDGFSSASLDRHC